MNFNARQRILTWKLVAVDKAAAMINFFSFSPYNILKMMTLTFQLCQNPRSMYSNTLELLFASSQTVQIGSFLRLGKFCVADLICWFDWFLNIFYLANNNCEHYLAVVEVYVIVMLWSSRRGLICERNKLCQRRSSRCLYAMKCRPTILKRDTNKNQLHISYLKC